MPNDPLADEYEASIWAQPFSFPPSGTLTTATLTTAAGLSFAPSSGDTMLWVYNNSTRTVSIGFATSTTTSSALTTFTTTMMSLAAGVSTKIICSREGGSIGLVGSGAGTIVNVVYWGCSKTATT